MTISAARNRAAVSALRCTVATRLTVPPSIIAVFWPLDNSVSTTRWLWVATRVDPLAVATAVAEWRVVQISVVAFFGILCDAITARAVDPCACITARVSILAVAPAVITLLSRLQDSVS